MKAVFILMLWSGQPLLLSVNMAGGKITMSGGTWYLNEGELWKNHTGGKEKNT